MRVLVTGGNGFLGMWVIKRLLALGLEVRAFDIALPNPLAPIIVGADTEQISGDITSPTDVSRAVHGCDAVIHLASMHLLESARSPHKACRINLEGTLNVFDACVRHDVRKVLYCSSIAVYSAFAPHRLEPDSFYGGLKLAVEAVARSYWREFGLSSTGIRPAVIYGPGREYGQSAGITQACLAAAQDTDCIVPFSGAGSFVYVNDVAHAFQEVLLAQQNGAHVFDLPGETRSIDDVVDVIRRCSPHANISVEGSALQIATGIDARATYAAFPSLHQTGVEEGIAETVRFYRSHSGHRGRRTFG